MQVKKQQLQPDMEQHHRLNGHKFEEMVKGREAWPAAVHGVTESDGTEQLNELTTF